MRPPFLSAPTSPLSTQRPHLCCAGGASFYGTKPWYWYATEGFPTVLGPLLPLYLSSLRARALRPLHTVIGGTVLAYSALPHKEFRFLYSLMPAAIACMASAAVVLERPLPPSPPRAAPSAWARIVRAGRWALARALPVLLLANAPMAAYFGLVHQRGPVDLAQYAAARAGTGAGAVRSLDLLMPCHSAPAHAVLHAAVEVESLRCPPPLRSLPLPHYDEADAFFRAPAAFLAAFYREDCGPPAPPEAARLGEWTAADLRRLSPAYCKPLPTHIAAFSGVLDGPLAPFLREKGYRLEREFPNTHTPAEGRHGRSVLLYARE